MDPALLKSCLILVRHGPVADRYHGLCYGRSDVELSLEGEGRSRELAETLAALPVDRIMHSGLVRTSYLAGHLAERLGMPTIRAEALCERDFGHWELRPWDDLYREYGEAILKMVSEPATFRPGAGETTYEMRNRLLDWFRGVPRNGLSVAVTHGGPIAALLGTLRNLPVEAWPALIPPQGQWVSIDLESAS
ncbi:MAG TPA: histidine phosphatase family protein [Isosphaeraceae bacterium]|nr:histidine phosphatase family protein [Isosphaeraceae bacterium]